LRPFDTIAVPHELLSSLPHSVHTQEASAA
jgi:hypothetical protein